MTKVEMLAKIATLEKQVEKHSNLRVMWRNSLDKEARKFMKHCATHNCFERERT